MIGGATTTPGLHTATYPWKDRSRRSTLTTGGVSHGEMDTGWQPCYRVLCRHWTEIKEAKAIEKRTAKKRMSSTLARRPLCTPSCLRLWLAVNPAKCLRSIEAASNCQRKLLRNQLSRGGSTRVSSSSCLWGKLAYVHEPAWGAGWHRGRIARDHDTGHSTPTGLQAARKWDMLAADPWPFGWSR
ncbi:hypothetical protein HC256_008185 [Beauveria bassiana]|nr:hypothetical protein HC256_008185 [Beauveria bassiana]